MTKAIPHGTRNQALNLLIDEQAMIRKLAYDRGTSINQFMLRVFRRGLAATNPAEAKQLARMRRDRLRSASLLALIVTSACFGFAPIRRAPRLFAGSVRVVTVRKIEG